MLAFQSSFILVPILLGSLWLPVQPQTPVSSIILEKSEEINQPIEPEQLHRDLSIFRTALEEAHPGIYRYSTKADMDKLFEKTARQLNHPMDTLGFYRILVPICAAIKCGHTSVQPPDTYQKQIQEMALFPYDVEVIKDRVYIVRDFSPEAERLDGTEVSAINNIPIGRILALMMAALPRDGDIRTRRVWRIGHEGVFQEMLPLLVGLRSPFKVTYRSGDGEEEKRVVVEGITSSQRKEVLHIRYAAEVQKWETQPNASLTYPNIGVALLTIHAFRGFADSAHKKPLSAFLTEAFTELKNKGTQSLILDLRDNGGGQDVLGKQLLAHLLDKSFLYYEDLIINTLTLSFAQYANPADPIPRETVEKGTDGKWHCTKHPNWGLQQPATPAFQGRVIALMNGGSFSTTCEFLSNLHYHHRAVFVGEEPGGAYYGNNSGFGTIVTLPNSNISLRLPMMSYYLAVKGFKPASHGVPPDRHVTPTIKDIMAQDDPAMRTALKLAE